jgi:membrane dipeptidase
VLEETDGVFAVRTRGDLAHVGGDGIGLMLSLEGAEALAEDAGALDRLWEAGVRMVGLTHNPPNAFAGGIDAPEAGLTAAGRGLVDELVARGAILDLAHLSERSFFDVLEQAPEATVLVSHAGCRAVRDHRRNVSDEQLRALADRGGVFGLMALQLVVGPGADVERLVDHVDHAVGVMGIDGVCLGADFIDQVIAAEIAAGIEPAPMTVEALEAGGGLLGLPDLQGPEDFPRLVDALRRRGYEGPERDAILSGNLLRILASLPG